MTQVKADEQFQAERVRELQERLEAMERKLEERIKEIQEWQRRYEELRERDQKRSAQLAVLSQLSERAMRVFDVDLLCKTAVEAIWEHFQFFDVALFWVDESCGELILKAQAGAYRHSVQAGYRQKIGKGIIGWVAQTGQVLCANDVSKEPRYFMAFPEEEQTKSELAVPIKEGNKVIGVIDVESPEVDAFDYEDILVLQAIADQMAHTMEGIRLFQRVKMFQEFNEQIINSFPESVAVVNERGFIVAANEKFCSEVGRIREEVINHHIGHIVDQSLIEKLDLVDAITEVLSTGEEKLFLDVLHFSPKHPPKLLEVRLVRITGAERKRAILLVDDVTQRTRRVYQLQMMLQIIEAMESTLELNRLLHAILTCVTAGPGLGFNRAILFLANDDKTALEAAMAVGPASHEEASAIWSRLAQEQKGLEDFLSDYPGDDARWSSPFQKQVQGIVLSLSEKVDPLVQSFMSKEVMRLSHPAEHPSLHPRLRQVLGGAEVVCVPLVAKDEALGLIVADNAFSGQPIDEEDVSMLRMFAGPAGLAIDNARTYTQLREKAQALDSALSELKEAQERLVRSEKLAAIGEVSAKVAHEVRNPLVTIGGFARNLARKPEEVWRVKRNADIIVSEVEKLEIMLREMLDFTSPQPPKLHPDDLNSVVAALIELNQWELQAKGITLSLQLSPELPPVMLDRNQMERALLNLWQNAVHAIEGSDSGSEKRMTIRTWREDEKVKLEISDTGVGIPPEAIPNIFTPFFTTKTGGSGLGLAVAKKIIEDHKGEISVSSRAGAGTTFIISLPVWWVEAAQR